MMWFRFGAYAGLIFRSFLDFSCVPIYADDKLTQWNWDIPSNETIMVDGQQYKNGTGMVPIVAARSRQEIQHYCNTDDGPSILSGACLEAAIKSSLIDYLEAFLSKSESCVEHADVSSTWFWRNNADIYHMYDASTKIINSLIELEHHSPRTTTDNRHSKTSSFLRSVEILLSTTQGIIEALNDVSHSQISTSNYVAIVSRISPSFFTLSKILSDLLLEKHVDSNSDLLSRWNEECDSMHYNQQPSRFEFVAKKRRALNCFVWMLRRIDQAGVYGIRERDFESEFNGVWNHDSWSLQADSSNGVHDSVISTSLKELTNPSPSRKSRIDYQIDGEPKGHDYSVPHYSKCFSSQHVSGNHIEEEFTTTLFSKLLWILEILQFAIRIPYMDCWRFVAGQHASSYSVKKRKIVGYGLHEKSAEKPADHHDTYRVDHKALNVKENGAPISPRCLPAESADYKRFHCPPCIPTRVWTLWGKPTELQGFQLFAPFCKASTSNHDSSSPGIAIDDDDDSVILIKSLDYRAISILFLRCLLVPIASILSSYVSIGIFPKINVHRPPTPIPFKASFAPCCA